MFSKPQTPTPTPAPTANGAGAPASDGDLRAAPAAKKSASLISNDLKIEGSIVGGSEVQIDGSITGDLQTFLLGNLAELTRSFVNTLAGLAVVSAEEIWNAAVGVIWGAINQATGLALKVP